MHRNEADLQTLMAGATDLGWGMHSCAVYVVCVLCVLCVLCKCYVSAVCASAVRVLCVCAV